MVIRRRPLLRAAVVSGGAYWAGKRAAQREAEQDEQNARLSDLEQQGSYQRVPAQQGPPPAPPAAQAPPAAPPSMIDQLNQLAQLHQQGSLTDEEFAAAKAKLL